MHTYLVALVVPNQKQLVALANSLGVEKDDPLVTKHILESLQKTGKSNGLLPVEIPKKISICKEEWTPENGMTTAALKIRRNIIYNYYKRQLEEMYKS